MIGWLEKRTLTGLCFKHFFFFFEKFPEKLYGQKHKPNVGNVYILKRNRRTVYATRMTMCFTDGKTLQTSRSKMFGLGGKFVLRQAFRWNISKGVKPSSISMWNVSRSYLSKPKNIINTCFTRTRKPTSRVIA